MPQKLVLTAFTFFFGVVVHKKAAVLCNQRRLINTLYSNFSAKWMKNDVTGWQVKIVEHVAATVWDMLLRSWSENKTAKQRVDIRLHQRSVAPSATVLL